MPENKVSPHSRRAVSRRSRQSCVRTTSLRGSRTSSNEAGREHLLVLPLGKMGHNLGQTNIWRSLGYGRSLLMSLLLIAQPFLFIRSIVPVRLDQPRAKEPRRDNCLGTSWFIYSTPPRGRHNTQILSAFDGMEPRASRPLAMLNPIYRCGILPRWDLDVQDLHSHIGEPKWAS